MTSLIDRYVFTALRRVPEGQRADIDRELRASIDDAVDARVDGGEPRDTAVAAALTELGDPDRLADNYADRLPYLIGPEAFPAWRKLTTVLLTIVLPIVVAVVTVIQVIDRPAVGPAIGVAVRTAITTGVHMVFWTTLIFAILERTGARTPLNRPWTPDDLPKYEGGSLTRAQLAAGLVWPVILIVALILQQFTLTEVPVLDPDNWSSWWLYIVAALLAECGYQIWVYRRAAWTHTVTVVNAVLAVLTFGPVAWLMATHRFYNQAFLDRLDWGSVDAAYWLTRGGVVLVLAIAVWDIAEAAYRAERARRGRPIQLVGTGGFPFSAR